MKKFVSILALAISMVMLSSCACWSDKKDSKECIILRQVLDCTQDSILVSAPGLLPALTKLITAGEFDSDTVINVATSFGFKDATCILAALEADFTRKVAVSPTMPLKAKVASSAFAKWKADNGITGVVVKVK